MAYDSVRAQLDKLLGPDRNGPLTAASTTPTDYHHPEICKNYLLGFCPDDLHIKHRSEPGSCRRRHSDSAKASFEKDVASFKAVREKARWTAALLSQCRAIIMDEDRKIRCHARRLKDTYNAQGDLAGLMIQTFDTLKKLGMVNKDAKIRVLSEMDNEDFLFGSPSNDAVDQENEHTLESLRPRGESNNSTSPVDGDAQKSSLKHGDQHSVPADQGVNTSNTNSGSESDGDDGKGNDVDDADDDDDFGLIKVIPAVNKMPQETRKPQISLPNADAHAVVDIHGGTHSSVAPTLDESKVKDKSNHASTTAVTAEHHEDKSGRIPLISTEKVSEAEAVKQSTQEVATGNREEHERKADGAIKEPAVQSETTPEDGEEPSPRDERGTGVLSDTTKNAETGQDRMQSAPSMDEFYERGVGPDGLLMLDRKQSLRVCACCGGYISLVDAESRLLSHYGGKSHHSLAQLRKKIVELEAQVLTEPESVNRPVHLRDRSEEREPVWSYRNNERRHSHERRRSGERYGKASERYHDRHANRNGSRSDDRRRVRSRRDGRGFGTADWYNNFVREDVSGQSSRRGEERSNFSGNQSQRHSNGRKRYRSRSPVRDFRRPRRHY